MPRLVLDVKDRRPIWAMPPWVPERVGEGLPAGWDLFVPSSETDGSGDGIVRTGAQVLEAVREAQVYIGWGVPADVVEAGERLEWAHSLAAGVGGSLTPTMRARDIVFTNSAGVHAAPIAETVLAMILYFSRGLDLAEEGKRRGEWWQDPYFAADAPLFELQDATVGILGFGGIGREVARRVASLGARVVGLKRTAATPEDAALQPVGGGASLESRIEVVSGTSGLDRLLGESDVLVVCAPETDETRGIVDAAALARLRPGAILINVARGKLVDEGALMEALSSGRLRGVGLDVFWKEPLPTEHPLWALPNALLTPHVSGITRAFWGRETDLIVRNLERYLAGASVDQWENVVDKQAGY